jgi:hypothetical protein
MVELTGARGQFYLTSSASSSVAYPRYWSQCEVVYPNGSRCLRPKWHTTSMCYQHGLLPMVLCTLMTRDSGGRSVDATTDTKSSAASQA